MADINTDGMRSLDVRDINTTLDAMPSVTVWAVTGGGKEDDRIHGLTLDKLDNIVITGHIQGTASFGSLQATSSGGRDVFVAKILPNGDFSWVRNGGSPGNDNALSVYVDDKNQILVVGSVGGGQSTFGGHYATCARTRCPFLATMDANGTVSSFEVFTDVDGTFADVQVRASGERLVAGEMSGNGEIGSIPINSAGGTDGFLAELSKDAVPIWVSPFGGDKNDGVYEVEIDNNGNAILTGWSGGGASFDAIKAPAFSCNFVASAHLKNGQYMWVTPLIQNGAWGALSRDAKGQIYVSGNFQGNVKLGTTTLASKGGADVFVAGLTAGGSPRWATAAGGAGIADTAFGSAYRPGYGLAVAGQFSGVADFGGKTRTSAGSNDPFVIQVSESGAIANVWTAGGKGNDTAWAVAIDSTGAVVVGGMFEGPTTFEHFVGTPYGMLDLYVWKIAPQQL
jgi:hypothetical protein